MNLSDNEKRDATKLIQRNSLHSQTFPEEINQEEETHPSKRILKLSPRTHFKTYRNPKIRGIRGKKGADEGGVSGYSDRG